MRIGSFYAVILACVLCAVLLFWRSILPSHVITLQPPALRPQPLKQPVSTSSPDDWEFDYRRDGKNYGLTEEQCFAAFPDLYKEIDRAVAFRKSVGNITIDELQVAWRGDGIVRAMILNNELRIIDAHAVSDRNHRPRSIATLNAINRAVTAYSGRLPNIEFTVTDHDEALIGATNNHTTFAYARKDTQETLWLMPDFGFWAWPDVGIRSYSELVTLIRDSETFFPDKTPKLVWRGALKTGSSNIRRALINQSKGQPWSDVVALEWGNQTDVEAKRLTMDEHCGYMFVAQTEGNTYSGRLKYLLNCDSVVVSHDLKWIEHYHHLMQSSGPNQNYIKLDRSWSKLANTMNAALTPEGIRDMERIAQNSKNVFRERYLTPAAEACYWRALIRGWASVQGFEPQRSMKSEDEEPQPGVKRAAQRLRGTPFEAYAIMEVTEWKVPPKPRHMCIDD